MARKSYAGKFEKGGVSGKRSNGRFRTVVICIVLVLLLAAGGTFAYLIAKTDGVLNQFQPASVTCQVNAREDETFDVTNTGNIDAFIRAAIVVNWMDENGNVRGLAPSARDYTLTMNTSDWWQDPASGFWYYTAAVPTGETTTDLIEAVAITSDVQIPEGYDLSVEVVAEAIQAEGLKDGTTTQAFQDAWGISSFGGSGVQ